MEKYIDELLTARSEYGRLGIADQIDYQKFHLYSIITHSTAIEGSTVTEIENSLLFDEGIAAKGRPMVEQLMNLDLKRAYEQAIRWAKEHRPLSVGMLKSLSALVMRNTGGNISSVAGDFDSSKGDLRLVGVTAGAGGRSYMDYHKVPAKLQEFCDHVNQRREAIMRRHNDAEARLLSFDAHNILVTIHPWADGNGRMSRLIMNYLQFEFGVVPTKVLKEDKAAYIAAINKSREEDDMTPFRVFMIQEHTKNLRSEIAEYKKTVDGDISILKEDVAHYGGPEKETASQRGGPETRQAILRLIEAYGKTPSREMAKRLGINRSAVSKHLKKMQEENLIRREGSQKSGRWVVCHKQ